MGLGERWREVARTYAEVNQLFGDIVKVTPSSKVVGDMAIFLMAQDMRPRDILKLDEHHDLALPNSVVEMFTGVAGRAAGRLAEEAAEDHSARREAGARPARREHARSRFRQACSQTGAREENRPRPVAHATMCSAT